MGITEIVFIIVGVIIFIAGYLLPARKKEVDEEVQLISEDEVRKLVAKEVEGAKEHISDIVDETITYAMEKSERSMERVTNEKIMAVNEYSDTVLEEINKNHQEVLFLYDMLNDKHENLKNTVSEVTKTAEEVKQTVKDAEITAKEAEETVKNAMDTVLDAVENVPEEVAEVHTAAEFDETLVDEMQQAMEDEFVPIAPPRVEIVSNPGGEYDYAAEPKAEKKKNRTQKTAKGADKVSATAERTAEMPSVDIQFANGKDNSRNSNERILELHKAGKSNMAIAKELGLGIGEVKLVIDLFEGL